jgi:hypothetical protein
LYDLDLYKMLMRIVGNTLNVVYNVTGPQSVRGGNAGLALATAVFDRKPEIILEEVRAPLQIDKRRNGEDQ